LAIVSQSFRCGPTLQFDDADLFEAKATELGHINPSLEFWLKENASSFDNALVIGAGFGLSSKQLLDAGAEVTSFEPAQSRFDLLEINCASGDNYKKAAGKLAGEEILYCWSDNQSQAVVGKTMGNNTQTIDVVTVDSLDLSLDLLLVYANGKELDVLDGAAATMAANPNMKIVIGWKPDTIENIEDAVSKLEAYGKTVSIIHWEPEGDTISLKEQFTGAHHNDSLKAVYKAELLLE
jgi:hypothetical protein|tara:strand:+ start:99 stop:809 length:711 start_codon:yes stop_codon:yes gene_type:complete